MLLICNHNLYVSSIYTSKYEYCRNDAELFLNDLEFVIKL